MDNHPTKPKPFGQRRFQNKFQQNRRDREQQAKQDGPEKQKTKRELAKKQPWQQYGRDQQRVRL